MASAPKGTARRDHMLKLQQKAQDKWEAAKAYEVDAPAGAWDGGKFMVTFPYPYMNGKLHLGHAFSLTKAEFAARYHRMLGKKALFPFAFHCTGMPIQAAAFKLKKEYELYGSPLPNFPCSPPEVVQTDAAAGEITIGWKAPTSTGGKTLLGYKVLVRRGAGSEYTPDRTHSAHPRTVHLPLGALLTPRTMCGAGTRSSRSCRPRWPRRAGSAPSRWTG